MTLNATEARSRLFALMDDVAESHQPLLITGRRNNAVLISEADWRAIEETLYLNQIPGMAASIREGMATPIDEMVTEPPW